MENAKHTPGPWKASIDMDGRHRHLAILTDAPEFKQENWPYHPKIATALHGGKGDCPREIAEANAILIAAAPELLRSLQTSQKILRQNKEFINSMMDRDMTAAITKATATK